MFKLVKISTLFTIVLCGAISIDAATPVINQIAPITTSSVPEASTVSPEIKRKLLAQANQCEFACKNSSLKRVLFAVTSGLTAALGIGALWLGDHLNIRKKRPPGKTLN
jgi:hypothetical protein